MTEEEKQARIAQLEARLAQLDQEEQAAQEPGLGGQALDYGMRALDYAGGLSRTAGSSLAEVLTGADTYREGDWGKAFKGQAPMTDELLDRAEIPKGATVADYLPVERGGMLDVSARGAAGFAGDVLSDPLTYGSMGLLPALKGAGILGKAGKATRVASGATKKAGESMFKSGFKQIDKKLAEKGKKPLSEVFLENGVTGGTMKTISKKAADFGQDLAQKRGEMYAKLDNAGATVDLEKASEKALNRINEIRKDPNSRELAAKLTDYVTNYIDDVPGGKATIQQASDWKTRFYDNLPDSAWKQSGKLKNDAKRVYKALGEGYKEQIVKDANKVIPDAGKKVDKLNESWGSIIEAVDPMTKEINKGVTSNAITSVDAMVGSLSPAALAAKKAADLSKTTGFRTRMGGGLMNLGKSGAPDIMLRRGAVEQTTPREPRGTASTSSWQKVGINQ